MNKKFLASICFAVAFAPALTAQQIVTDAKSAHFEAATQYYWQQNYAATLATYNQFLEQDERRNDADMDYFRAASEFALGRTDAAALLKVFQEKWPESLDRDRAKLRIGTAHLEQSDYARAGFWFENIDGRSFSAEERSEWLCRRAFSLLAQGKKADKGRADAMLRDAHNGSGLWANRARLYRSALLISDAKLDEAEQLLRPLASNKTLAPEAAAYRAEIALLKRDYKQASEESDRLFAQYPQMRERAQLLRVAGIAAFHLDQQSRCIDYLKKYASLVGDELAPLDAYALGVSYYKQSSMQEALRPLTIAATDKGELGAQANLYLGQARLKQHMPHEALIAMEAAASQNINKDVREVAMYNMAMIMRSTGQSSFGQAVKVGEQFLNEFPNSNYRNEMSEFMAHAYMSSKDYQTSLESIQRIARPTESILAAKQYVHARLAEQARLAGYDSKALTQLSAAINLGAKGPYYAEALYRRAEINYDQARLEDAIVDYQRFLTADKNATAANRSLAHYQLGYALFDDGRYSEAYTSFNHFVTSNHASESLRADAMSRMGDCKYMQRQFTAAHELYSQAIRSNKSRADYPLYRRALLEGLSKQYGKQIASLSELVNNYPKSDLLPAALFDRGRAAVLSNQVSLAERSFKEVINKHAGSKEARQASVQLGLLFYNTGRSNEAKASYKKVIEAYPHSDEAKLALADLRSIYLEEDAVDAYAAYLSKMGTVIPVDAGETEHLSFLAAETKYRRKQKDAYSSLQTYIDRYPKGADRFKAELYLADIDFQEQRAEEAFRRYATLIGQAGLPDDYKVEPRQRMAAMLYERQQYAEAYDMYLQLSKQELSLQEKNEARLGAAKSAFQIERFKDALVLCTDAIAEDETDASANKAELLLIRAKSYLALKRNKEALVDFAAISDETATPIGAEALVMQASIELAEGRTQKAKTLLDAFIAKSTPQQYWLARAFILLADTYEKMGDKFTARQYLESLKANYQGGESDIQQMINERLNK